jgi:hypothetical protein
MVCWKDNVCSCFLKIECQEYGWMGLAVTIMKQRGGMAEYQKNAHVSSAKWTVTLWKGSHSNVSYMLHSPEVHIFESWGVHLEGRVMFTGQTIMFLYRIWFGKWTQWMDSNSHTVWCSGHGYTEFMREEHAWHHDINYLSTFIRTESFSHTSPVKRGIYVKVTCYES